MDFMGNHGPSDQPPSTASAGTGPSEANPTPSLAESLVLSSPGDASLSSRIPSFVQVCSGGPGVRQDPVLDPCDYGD